MIYKYRISSKKFYRFHILIFIFSVYFISSLTPSVSSVLHPGFCDSFGLASLVGLLKSSAFITFFSALLLLLFPVVVDSDDYFDLISIYRSMSPYRDFSKFIVFYIHGCSLICSNVGRSRPWGLNILITRSLNSQDTLLTPTLLQYASSWPWVINW